MATCQASAACAGLPRSFVRRVRTGHHLLAATGTTPSRPYGWMRSTKTAPVLVTPPVDLQEQCSLGAGPLVNAAVAVRNGPALGCATRGRNWRRHECLGRTIGNTREFEQRALDSHLAVIGGRRVPDLSDVNSREALEERFRQAWPESKPARIKNHAAQLWAFGRRIQTDDLVALPLKMRSAIVIGRVKGPYQGRVQLQGPIRSRLELLYGPTLGFR